MMTTDLTEIAERLDEAILRIEKMEKPAESVLENSAKTAQLPVTDDRALHTTIDEMFKLLEEGNKDLTTISKSLSIPEDFIERWAKILEDCGLVEISYPIVGSPVLRIRSNKG